MSAKKIRACILMSVVGFLLIAVDVPVSTGISYPSKYENNKDIIGEYQYYAIKTFYGATCTMKKLDPEKDASVADGYYTDAEFVDDVFYDGIKIDVFNDIIGFLLLAGVCFKLSKYKKLFKPALVFSITSIVLKLLIDLFPFVLNGMPLCNIALGFGIAYTASAIIATFFMTKGYLALIQDSCCRDERLWLNTSWFVSMVLIIMLLLLRWLDLYGFVWFFTVVVALDIVIYGLILKRADEFAARNCKQLQ